MQVCKSSLPDDGTCRFSDEEGYLLVVADGMGGAAGGERASALAVGSLETFVLNTFKWFLHLGGREQSVLFDELRQGLEARRPQRRRAGPGRPAPVRDGDHAHDGLQRRHRPVHRPRGRLAGLPLPRRRRSSRSPKTIRFVQVLVNAGGISPGAGPARQAAEHRHQRRSAAPVRGSRPRSTASASPTATSCSSAPTASATPSATPPSPRSSPRPPTPRRRATAWSTWPSSAAVPTTSRRSWRGMTLSGSDHSSWHSAARRAT